VCTSFIKHKRRKKKRNIIRHNFFIDISCCTNENENTNQKRNKSDSTLSHTSARITSMKNERKKNGHIGMNANEMRSIVFFFICVLYVFKYPINSKAD
jgi:hypothetical protein